MNDSGFKYLPSNCKHSHKEYKPNAAAPKLIVCLDCGAILYMRLADGTEFVEARKFAGASGSTLEKKQ